LLSAQNFPTKLQETGVMPDVSMSEEDPTQGWSRIRWIRRLGLVQSAQLLPKIGRALEQPALARNRIHNCEADDGTPQSGFAPSPFATGPTAARLGVATILSDPQNDDEWMTQVWLLLSGRRKTG
jgi:hypothetical protein